MFFSQFSIIYFETELSAVSNKLLAAKIFNRDVHKHLKTIVINSGLVRDGQLCALHRFSDVAAGAGRHELCNQATDFIFSIRLP